jgi:hypothetical protein
MALIHYVSRINSNRVPLCQSLAPISCIDVDRLVTGQHTSTRVDYCCFISGKALLLWIHNDVV